jgi:flagellar L-ring protein precursor FlgH
MALIGLTLAFGPASWAMGQSSSLFKRAQAREAADSAATTRPAPNGALRANAGSAPSRSSDRNATLAAASLTAVKLPEPKVIKVHDLISVIVRYRLRQQTIAKMEQDSEWDVNAKLEAWFRLHDGKWNNQQFRAGRPEIKFENKNELENEGKTKRKDLFETRLMAKVLDIKPNGNLIIVGWQRVEMDEDVQYLRLTGECNRDHLSPDGSIMSDKIFALEVRTMNEGAVRDAVKRGWLKEFLDGIKPF